MPAQRVAHFQTCGRLRCRCWSVMNSKVIEAKNNRHTEKIGRDIALIVHVGQNHQTLERVMPQEVFGELARHAHRQNQPPGAPQDTLDAGDGEGLLADFHDRLKLARRPWACIGIKTVNPQVVAGSASRFFARLPHAAAQLGRKAHTH